MNQLVGIVVSSKIGWSTTPYGLIKHDTTSSTSLSNVGIYKSISLTGLIIGEFYQIIHFTPTLGLSGGPGTITIEMRIDGGAIASNNTVATNGSYQNPRYTIVGVFQATSTSHTLTYYLTGSNMTPNTADTNQRTAVIHLLKLF